MWFIQRHFTAFLVTIVAVLVAISINSSIKLLKTDPLTIKSVNGVEVYDGLKHGDEFTFDRTVCIKSDLIVTVHKEFHKVDTGNKFMMPSISYGAYAEDGCMNIQFAAVIPDRIPLGWYEYRPILIYQAEDSRRIAKPAPPVRVEVVE
jgi:hypothetical protein